MGYQTAACENVSRIGHEDVFNAQRQGGIYRLMVDYHNVGPLVQEENHSSSTISTTWRAAHSEGHSRMDQVAKDVVSAESMQWITNAAETIELDDATQVHSFADPDDPRMCIELDGMVKVEITHTYIRSKLVRIFNEHGAAAPQYDVLQAGKDYKDDMVETDWRAIVPEIHSFNSQMRKALKDAKVPHIYESIDQGYQNDSNPLGGVLAWKQVMELQSGLGCQQR